MSKSSENDYEKSWFVATVEAIINTVKQDLKTSQFQFEDTIEAAEWNSQVLEKYDNDFVEAMQNENNTILTPEAEFRNI